MTSLDQQIAEVVTRVAGTPGLVGLVFCGSGARGELRPSSDLDFVAVIDDNVPWPKPFRDGGREAVVNRAGRQVEVAFSTVGYLRRRMAETVRQGEPFRAEALLEGRVLLGESGRLDALIAEARDLIDRGPPPLAESDRLWQCYALWNQLKDIGDSLDDPHTARYLAARGFDGYVTFCFRLDRRWQPRPRMLLAALRVADTLLADHCTRFLQACSAPEQYASLTAIADHLARRFGLVFDAPYVSAALLPGRTPPE